MTCDELELQRDEYLATNVTCSNRWYNILRKYSFATEGVGLATVAFLGILANLLSIAILTKRTMKTQISALLITLAVFDILFLFCTFPVFSVMSIIEFVTFINECYYDEENNDGSNSTTRLEFLSPTMQDMYYYCLPFLYGFTHLCKVGSVFTTLAVSLERYFAVCHPLWIRIRRCPPAMYIILVTVFAFAFNIPKFLEFEAIVSETGGTAVKATALRTDQHYIVYYNFLTKTVITELFPYVSLIFLNACIYREIRRSVKLQQSMRCNQSQNEEIKSANVVVGVVALSIVCHIWKIVPDLYEAIIQIMPTSVPETNITDLLNHCSIHPGEIGEVPDLKIEMIIDTSHLLVAVNSAANFFIYYLLRKNFRDAVWKLLTCKNTDADRDRTNHLNSTANIQHCRSVMVHTTRTGLSTCDKGTQNSTTTTTTGHRRLSGIPLVKNGEVTTSTSNSITVKLMSYNVSQAAAENLNGSAKRKTGGGGGVMEDFDALIKEHEQYGLKEFKVDRLEITSISGKD